MPFYNLFREGGFPTLYPPRKTAVTADVLDAGLLYAILSLAFCFLIIIPGVRGIERLFYTIRVIIGLFVLACILICNFGQEWETAEIHNVPTQYRAGLSEEIHADIAVHIGLRSLNITLKSDPEVVVFLGGKVNETINYNERFHWDSLGFVAGRAGFGPFAGLYNREYRDAQLKGLPYPILWIAEYFTIDGEFIRFGRFYRQAGFYTHIMVWLAFPLWIMTMILFKMVMRYGGYFSMMTGLSLITANLIYSNVRNPLKLEIPFSEDHRLVFAWGWSFWLNLVNGLLAFILGLIAVILDICKPEQLATFFDFDLAQEYEEFYADPEQLRDILAEKKTPFRNFTKRFSPNMEKYKADDTENANGAANVEVDDSGAIKNPQAIYERRHFRKKTIMKSVYADQGKTPRPKPAPRKPPPRVQDDDDDDDYENAPSAVRFKAGSHNVAFEGDHH